MHSVNMSVKRCTVGEGFSTGESAIRNTFLTCFKMVIEPGFVCSCVSQGMGQLIVYGFERSPNEVV